MRVLPILLILGLVVYALFDCAQTPSAQMRFAPKPVWLLAILVLPVLGALGWLFLGRPRLERGPSRRGPGLVAPDDDPDFLRSLRPDPPANPVPPTEDDAGGSRPGA